MIEGTLYGMTFSRRHGRSRPPFSSSWASIALVVLIVILYPREP